jgi:hypothetical protein
MNKMIVITTINQPTESIEKFVAMSDWKTIIVGDLKTPHDSYKNMKNVIYLKPEDQEKIAKEYSDFIGWNISGRRNIGFIEAYRRGADVLALVDDDNIPYKNWGKDILVGNEIEVESYRSDIMDVFDPLFVTNNNYLWQRGFPIELVPKRDYKYEGTVKIKPMIQANLWDGDPDVDAVERLIYSPEVKFDNDFYYTSSNRLMPFNSQNTIIHRDVIPHFMLLPFIGRIDDIWGSYLCQILKGFPVVYGPATVYQKRNIHNLIQDYQEEVYGTSNCINFINKGFDFLPDKTKEAYNLYRKAFKC